MKPVAAVLTVLGLAYVGLALTEEHAKRGFVDPPIAVAFVALLVFFIHMAIGWSNPYGSVFRRMMQSWIRALRRRS